MSKGYGGGDATPLSQQNLKSDDTLFFCLSRVQDLLDGKIVKVMTVSVVFGYLDSLDESANSPFATLYMKKPCEALAFHYFAIQAIRFESASEKQETRN